MYSVIIYDTDIPWLAFAAGIATGSNNQAAAASLNGILNRLEPVGDTEPGPAEVEADAVFERELSAEEEAMFIAPPPAPPMNRQEDFGPGPVGPVLR